MLCFGCSRISGSVWFAPLLRAYNSAENGCFVRILVDCAHFSHSDGPADAPHLLTYSAQDRLIYLRDTACGNLALEVHRKRRNALDAVVKGEKA